MFAPAVMQGAWCIVSSPLILGMDMSNASTMADVWPYISNTEAIAVNQAWAGDPGRLIYPPPNAPDTAGATPPMEVWAKALPRGAVALLAINTGPGHAGVLVINLADVLGKPGWCRAAGSCAVRDIWAQKDGGKLGAGGRWSVKGLAPHDSAFVLVTPA